MADYTYDSELVADPFTFQRAGSSPITVYDVADANEATPLVLKDLNGLPLPNPLTSSAEAFVPAFVTTSPQVKMVGGGLRVVRSSFQGVRDEAVAAKVASQAAADAAQAAAEHAQAPTDAQVNAGVARANIPGQVSAVVPALVNAQVPPLVGPLVADAIAKDPSVVNGAAAAAQNTAGIIPAWRANEAVTAGQRRISPEGDVVSAKVNFTTGATYNAANWDTSLARWVKPALTSATDLNTLTIPGNYPVATGAVASSLVNAPPGFVNPGTVSVTQASASNNVIQQTVRMYWTGGLTRVFTRQSLGGVFPATWETEKPFMGTVPNGTDWNTVTAPGVYTLDSFTNSLTMTNLPPVPGGFAGTITVNPVTSARVTQVGIEYATTNPGKMWQRTSNTNGSFTAWEPVAGQVTALATGQDLNTLLTPGKYRTETSAVATSTLNNPGVVNPFLITVERISTGNGVYMQTVAEWSSTGPIISRRISLSSVFQPWVTDPGAGSRTAIDTWGDSLTEGGGRDETWLASEAWPARMATLLGGTVVTNRGRSGDTTDEILIRMGVHQLYFTVTGGSIPTSGAVTLQTKMKTFVPRDRNYAGSIAGVPGTLSFTFSTGAWAFTRTTSGPAVAVSGSVPFISGQTFTKTNPFVFWAGRNDWDFGVTGLDLSLADHILTNHRKVLDFLPSGEKRVVFFGPTLRSTETVGTAGYIRVWGLIDRMKYLFPGTFYCVMDYLIDHALDDAGITKTSADLAAIGNREAPPSVFITGDTTHFRKEIADVVGRLFAAPILAAKGFVN